MVVEKKCCCREACIVYNWPNAVNTNKYLSREVVNLEMCRLERFDCVLFCSPTIKQGY